MLRKISRLLLMIVLGSAPTTLLAQNRYGDFVDPSIGTAATGHAFPGPSRPFGLVQPGPDTGNGSWKYCSGYAWTDSSIRRFSQTHVNGAGQAGLGDVGILPFVGDIPNPQTASASFGKSNERIELGYYGVTLDDGIKVEIAAGRRLARYRLRFPSGIRCGVFLDFPWGLYRQEEYLPHLTTTCEVKRVSARRWTGHNHSEVWAPRDIHYVVEFDRDPDDVVELRRSAESKGPQTAVVFACGGVVELTLALSANSLAGALRNHDAECDRGFDLLVSDARAEWEMLFSRVRFDQVPAAERASVATAVYRLCLQPNEISDNGDPVRYSTFSLWDTFRDAHPLYEKLVPERVPGFINSILMHYDRWGYLPQWELWGRETGGMIGSHAVPVIVSAVEHGFVGFDKEKAYRAVRDTLRKSARPGMGRTYPRRTDWEVLDKYGYYPYDVVRQESVSRTLECCYDDYCASRFAKIMGKDDDAAFFECRSWAFTNLFDAVTCCFRPRDSRGRWLADFNPVGLSPHYTEGSALHWSWYVLHRPDWLIAAMGGRVAFENRLDAFFSGTLFPGAERASSQDITGLIGDYAHGNEPCHHVIGLYRLVGRDDKADALEKNVCDRFYRPAPDGLCGNDDCGQMSAWYLHHRNGIGDGWRDGFVSVVPESTDEAFANPLKGFRVKLSKEGVRHEFAGVAHCYLPWNELENVEGDANEKIKDVCNRIFRPIEGTHIKVIPRVVLKYGLDDSNGRKAKYYFPKDLVEDEWEGKAFERRLVRMIEKLGACWDDDPRIAWIEMGIIGAWGEHHHPRPSLRLQKLMGDAFIRAFRVKHVLVRSGEDFTDYDFGYYWDSWAHIQQWNGPGMGSQGAPSMLKRIERGLYRRVPIEGEVAYDWGRLIEQPGLSPDDTLSTARHLDFLEMTIRKMHGSALGWISCYSATNTLIRAGADRIQKVLGYRFELKEARWSGLVRRGGDLQAAFKVQNVGSAPFYYNWPVVLSLIDRSGHVVWEGRFKTDLRTWLPGEDWNNARKSYDIPPQTVNVKGIFNIPSDLPCGSYGLALAILDPMDLRPAVRFAIKARMPDGRHPLGEVVIK